MSPRRRPRVRRWRGNACLTALVELGVQLPLALLVEAAEHPWRFRRLRLRFNGTTAELRAPQLDRWSFFERAALPYDRVFAAASAGGRPDLLRRGSLTARRRWRNEDAMIAIRIA